MPDSLSDRESRIAAIVIGASAGGVDALLKILGGLPAHYRLPIFVVLHMRDDRESRLAEVFQQHVAVPVRQAKDKEEIQAGVLYFAGPGYHLSLESDYSFSLSGEDAVHYSRPAIDILMSSAADVYGASLAGFLLTGANQDGAEGLAAIQQAGGLTIVQDPHEAQIDVMPKAAIARNQPDLILTLREMHTLLMKLGTS